MHVAISCLLATSLIMISNVLGAEPHGRHAGSQRWSHGTSERTTRAEDTRQQRQRAYRMEDQQVRRNTVVHRQRQRQRTAGPEQLTQRTTRSIVARQSQRQLAIQRRLAGQRQVVSFGPQFGVRNRFGIGGYYGPPRVVAYQPVVTWYPTGATMSAGGVVSPGGRHVRVGVQPYFSSIRAVHTYNLRTGEMRRIR